MECQELLGLGKSKEILACIYRQCREGWLAAVWSGTGDASGPTVAVSGGRLSAAAAYGWLSAHWPPEFCGLGAADRGRH